MKKYIILGIIIVVIGILYICNRKTYSIEFGLSFDRQYANYLGLDWKNTYTKMLTDLKPKYIRISANWNTLEGEKGKYTFADLDWQMNEAKKHNTKVLLVIGQKTPHWPECHVPRWLETQTKDEIKEDLLTYVRTVVERYKKNTALDMWQVENEPFIHFEFGQCLNYHSEFTYDEIALVRELDPDNKILVTDSGEMGLWRKARKAGDYFGTTLYRIVRTPKGYIWSYDWVPAVIYRWKALFTGVDLNSFFISELQAEPWLTGEHPKNTPREEQEKTMNLERLSRHVEYARHVGAKRAYLWGVEWWYFMEENYGERGYLELGKDILTNF